MLQCVVLRGYSSKGGWGMLGRVGYRGFSPSAHGSGRRWDCICFSLGNTLCIAFRPKSLHTAVLLCSAHHFFFKLDFSFQQYISAKKNTTNLFIEKLPREILCFFQLQNIMWQIMLFQHSKSHILCIIITL